MVRVLRQAFAISVFVIMFSFATETWSEPVISSVGGTFREGEAVTIYGSDFGTKAQAAPLKWDNFENGANETQVPARNYDFSAPSEWGFSLRSDNVTYTDVDNLPGSGLCSKHDMDDYYDNLQRTAYLKWGTDSDSLKKLYVTFWVNFTFGTDYSRHQVKLWRIESHIDESMKFAQYNWGPQDPAYYYCRQTGAAGSLTDHYFSNVAPHPERKWFQIEVQAEQSNDSVADGSIKVWHSRAIGDGAAIVKALDLSNIVTRSGPSYWDRVYLGEVTTNLDHTAVTSGVINYFDNFYVDNSWARVVVGDASTYDACTHRAIQIPSAWSNTSITLTANTSSLPYGTAYLYVVDNNGVYNTNGFPITVERSPEWLSGIINKWKNGNISRDALNRAIFWYVKGEVPVGDPMAELSEQDIGNALKLALPQ